MSLRTPAAVGKRPRHNPQQLRCLFGCRRWFRNQSGLTKHTRIFHPQAEETLPGPLRQRQRSPPINANDARNLLPIHTSDEFSSEGNRDSTPPCIPLAEITFDNAAGPGSPIHQDRLFSPVHTHASSRELSPDSEHNELISKVFHPVINGLYMTVLISKFF